MSATCLSMQHKGLCAIPHPSTRNMVQPADLGEYVCIRLKVCCAESRGGVGGLMRRRLLKADDSLPVRVVGLLRRTVPLANSG
jgi:hypothetical protein